MNESTSMVAGRGVVSSGGPAQKPTATLRMANIGLLNAQVAPDGSDSGVNVASIVSSTPMTMMLGCRMTQ